MTLSTRSRRDMADAVALGREALAECFRAMHSTVVSDVGVMSRVGGGWPSFLRDECDADARPRKHYTPRQLKNAAELCEAFTKMEGVTHPGKRAAVAYALSASPSWKKTAAVTGFSSWSRCRSQAEGAYVGFTYLLGEREGVHLERMGEVR